MPDTIYLKCSAKEKRFASGSSLVNIGVKAEDLRAFLDAYTNERGWLNLTVKERREVGKYGDTHMVTLDTWDGAGGSTPVAPPAIPESDIPF
jgi:hypothetical protein